MNVDRLNMLMDEMKCNSTDFLQCEFEKEEQDKINKFKSETIPSPIKNGNDGKYYIDLKTILENNEKVTSKQILIPFFRNTMFNELEIICGHIPLWFEAEFKNLNLTSEVEYINEDNIRVTVYSNNCNK